MAFIAIASILTILFGSCRTPWTYNIAVTPFSYDAPKINGRTSVKLVVKLSMRQVKGHLKSNQGDLISSSQLILAVESNFKACLESAGLVVVPQDLPNEAVSAVLIVTIHGISISDDTKELMSSIILMANGKAVYSKSITRSGKSIRDALFQTVSSTTGTEEFLQFLSDNQKD